MGAPRVAAVAGRGPHTCCAMRSTAPHRGPFPWQAVLLRTLLGPNCRASPPKLPSLPTHPPTPTPTHSVPALAAGSGKTSLLNALAGRLPRAGKLEGEVLVNGVPRSRGFRSITAYVLQDDVLFSTLTVRETFEFAANIRLPASITKATRKQVRPAGPGTPRDEGGRAAKGIHARQCNFHPALHKHPHLRTPNPPLPCTHCS